MKVIKNMFRFDLKSIQTLKWKLSAFPAKFCPFLEQNFCLIVWKIEGVQKSSRTAIIFWQCTMGRGGVQTKGHQGACYSLWNLCVKLLASLKIDPSCFRKCPEQCFLRHDLKIFLEFKKKNSFTISFILKMTIIKYFFVKKKL